MATNIVQYLSEPVALSVACTHPTTPNSGDPVRYGVAAGIALTDEGDGGNATANTSVLFTPCVVELLVDDDGGSGIAVGAKLYYHDTQTGTPSTSVNNASSGANAIVGQAMEAVSANATATIKVRYVPTLL